MAGGLDLCACVKTPQNQPAKKDERQENEKVANHTFYFVVGHSFPCNGERR